jgi:hypothetical protein
VALNPTEGIGEPATGPFESAVTGLEDICKTSVVNGYLMVYYSEP